MTTIEILAAFPQRSALVVGDICLDRWCTYDPALSEASRETGIPRIAVVSSEVTPGAGGTVANNLAALGIGRVAVLGSVGEDGFGYELKRALEMRAISTELLVTAPALPTFTYTKLLNLESGEEDQPRVDFVHHHPLPRAVEDLVIERLRGSAALYEVILVSDQAETDQGGIVTARLREVLGGIGKRHPEKLIWVDSRLRSHLFRDVVLKPNEDEAAEACRAALGHVDYGALRALIGSRPLFVTLGARGVAVVDADGERVVPAPDVGKPVDICGAGDSFSAGAAMALAITGCPDQAARFGNLVASITIMKKGTGIASPAEVRASA